MSFEDKRRHLYIWELSGLIALCAVLLSGLWAEGRQASIAGSLVRLHVLAVSDAPEEQAIKLQVRDAVLACIAPRLKDVQGAKEAGTVLAKNLPLIREAAEQAAQGRPVHVTLGEERYPARSYAGFTLPAGRYRSLRVVLGEGKGHNWWCVVFPPVCLAAVEKEAMQPVMNPVDYALITREDGWEIRFWIVELWGKLFNSLEF